MSTLKLPSKNPTRDARDVERFAPAKLPPAGASFSPLPDRNISLDKLEMRIGREGDPIPVHWSKGALLNVRNRGDCYIITLYPEEFDPRYPERAMTFPNTWTCQDFVSKWYARETPDPRAR